MSPRVTVLLPVYNAMPHLRYTVESLQNQTLEDFEVLVFDDGSTDGSPGYLDSIDDPRFAVVHQENVGLAVTLNRMLERVDTEYVARIDSDDIALPGRLEKQLAFMDSHPEAAVVGTRAGYVMGRKSMASLGIGRARLRLSYGPAMATPPWWHPDLDGDILVHSSVMMRVEMLQEVGGYPEIVPGQDLALWYRFAEEGRKLASMDEILMLVRISPAGISSSNLALQARTWEYIRMSHRMRQGGEEPPSLDSYLRDRPQSAEMMEYRAMKAEFRGACGMLLAGNVLRGLWRIARVSARRPKILTRMITSRIGWGAGNAA